RRLLPVDHLLRELCAARRAVTPLLALRLGAARGARAADERPSPPPHGGTQRRSGALNPHVLRRGDRHHPSSGARHPRVRPRPESLSPGGHEDRPRRRHAVSLVDLLYRFEGLFTWDEGLRGTRVLHRETVVLRSPISRIVDPLLRGWLARDIVEEMGTMKRSSRARTHRAATPRPPTSPLRHRILLDCRSVPAHGGGDDLPSCV